MSKPLKKPRPSMIQREEEKMVTSKIKSKGIKRRASPSHDQSSENGSLSRTVPSTSTSEIKVNFSFIK